MESEGPTYARACVVCLCVLRVACVRAWRESACVRACEAYAYAYAYA